MIDLDNLSPAHLALFRDEIKTSSEKYNRLVEQICDLYPRNLVWNLSCIASRDPSLSKLHRRCCQLEFLNKVLPDLGSHFELKSSCNQFNKVIFDTLIDKKTKIKTKKNLSIIQLIKSKTRPLFGFFLILKNTIPEIIFSRFTKSISSIKIKKSNPITLLDTFVISTSFNKNIYYDRYYTGAISKIEKSISKDIFYIPTFVGIKFYQYFQFFKKIRKYNRNFILKEDYLKISDYVWAFKEMLSLREKSKILKYKSFSFSGYNMTRIISDEIKKMFINDQSFKALLNYRFVKRLKEAGINVRLLVDWNENQLIDRGLNKGFKIFFPETKTIAYQGFIVDYQYHLYLKPTEYEVKNGFLPQKYCMMGDGYKNIINEYSKSLKVFKSPAFRYQHLWEDSKPLKKDLKIIISLPIQMEIVKKILIFLNNAFENSQMSYRLYFKPHPTNDIKKIKYFWRKYFFKNSQIRMEIIQDSFDTVLRKTSVLITTYSSTGMESIVHGIPTIVLTGLDIYSHSPLPINLKGEYFCEIIDSQSLVKILKEYLSFTPIKKRTFKKYGANIKHLYFMRTNKQLIYDFLDIK